MIEYITTRNLENREGEIKGKIRVLKLKEAEFAKVEYVCPECGFEEKTEKEWKKPFSINCSNCGFLMRIKSLRYEIKKMRKRK
jgi:predicted RNA-binding Zn-ribbon protein involved in translation (DUF1610 family)